MKTIGSVLATTAVLSLVSIQSVHAQTHEHVAQNLGEAKWGEAPPLLPPGAQIAVLAGDPTKAMPYAVRLKFPAHYQIPAHSHPTDENIVVVSGAFTVGMGNKLAEGASANKVLKPGGFALMPVNMNHFAYTTAQPVTIVLYGQGPVEFKYVDPNDDPRNARTSNK